MSRFGLPTIERPARAKRDEGGATTGGAKDRPWRSGRSVDLRDQPRVDPDVTPTRDEDAEAIDPRIEARRLAVLEERRRRRRKRLLVFALVCTVIAGLYLLTRTPALDVDAVSVTGNAHTTSDQIRMASGIRVGDRLLDLDVDRAAQGIEQLPWIRSARVERTWRGTVSLVVTERVPQVAMAGVAPVGAPPTWLLVDGERRVVAATPIAPAELPVIEVAGLDLAAVQPGATLDQRSMDAISVARALPAGVRSRVGVVRAVDARSIELTLRPSGVVQLGAAHELEQKVLSLQTVFGQVDLRCLDTINLRVADAPVLTRAGTCA